MPTNIELVALDRRAVLKTVEIVDQIEPDDLSRATPCGLWTLADLLAHMTIQHRGFARAAGGAGSVVADWSPPPLAADPRADYRDAAQQVLTAFAASGATEREFALPEISTEVGFPGRRAIGFHLIDNIVHGWDVARSLGQEYALEPDVGPVALAIARAVPEGDARDRPGAAFAHGLGGPAGAGDLEEILLLLGRSPSWPAA
jgi:uncharacterized protein (TIGR03086 family)